MAISRQTHEIQEGQSGQVTFTLKDETGTAVALAAMSAMTLLLYDQETRSVINSRNNQNVLNANDVTMHATSGLVTWTVKPLDTPIVTVRRAVERHVGLFIFTWASGAKAYAHEVVLDVSNIGLTP